MTEKTKTTAEQCKDYYYFNIKRLADAAEKRNGILEKMNWNLGFVLEIHKRANPELAKEIEAEWIKRKEDKDKESSN